MQDVYKGKMAGAFTRAPEGIPEDYRLSRFLKNAEEGQEYGYDTLCAECGVGVSTDADLHDEWCERAKDNDYR